METTRTLKDLIQEHNVRMSATYRGEHKETMPKDGYRSGYEYYQDDWACELRCGKRQMTIDYHMGKGHEGKEPTVEDVLSSLCLDASSLENAGDFEDWARDYGYDPDSRKAESIYRAVQMEVRKLKKLLGSAYQDFIYAEQD
jgi:hypothetical protein